MSIEMKQCLRCGRCCRRSIIEDVLLLDLWREPRLVDVTEELRDSPGWFFLKTPCPFLRICIGSIVHNDCSIYPTRPSCCVTHVPGTYIHCPQYDPDDQEYLDKFTG